MRLYRFEAKFLHKNLSKKENFGRLCIFPKFYHILSFSTGMIFNRFHKTKTRKIFPHSPKNFPPVFHVRERRTRRREKLVPRRTFQTFPPFLQGLSPILLPILLSYLFSGADFGMPENPRVWISPQTPSFQIRAPLSYIFKSISSTENPNTVFKIENRQGTELHQPTERKSDHYESNL